MCSICGIVGHHEQGALEKMMDSLAHRGPDDKGSFVSDDVELGHNRLSIIDTSSNGRQPMSNENGSLWITFNGEIYNFVELRRELEKSGRKFRSQTDTEVILSLYESEGLDFLHKLEGMFALGIYDQNNDRLVLARDRVGIKPLYYSTSGGTLRFASEAKALLLKQPTELSDLSLDDFFGRDGTAFIGVEELSPGELLVVEGGQLRKRQYYELRENAVPETQADIINHLACLIESSVVQRLVSDRSIGIYFSGGLDSSLLASIAKTHYGNSLIGYCVGTSEINEFEQARKTGNNLGFEVVTIELSPSDIVYAIPKVIFHLEDCDPRNVEFGVMHYFLSLEAAKRDVRVVLSGEGADELFGGYDNRYDKERFTTKELVARMHYNHLKTQDRCSMANAVEVRVPFLDDTRLLEFALGLPPELREDKFVLREVARRDLAPEVAQRRKGYGHVRSGIPQIMNAYFGFESGGTLQKRFDVYKRVFERIFQNGEDYRSISL